jgi:hypothetical protein
MIICGLTVGDLNDFEDSLILEVMYANDVLTNTWFAYPGAPYSYIFDGFSQVLDHILLTPAANEWLESIGTLQLYAIILTNPMPRMIMLSGTLRIMT